MHAGGKGISDAKAIAAGDYHSMVLKADGSVWAAGKNTRGQLGDGTTNSNTGWEGCFCFKKVLSAGQCNTGVEKGRIR